MDEYSIWNLVKSPSLRIRDKYISRKVKLLLQEFILPDEAIYRIKNIFEKEIASGLFWPNQTLSMNVTFLSDRYTFKEGEFMSICAHSHYLAVTLVHLETDCLPRVQKKSYPVNIGGTKKSKFKVFETITKYVKDFFYEFDLRGKIIPTAFCTDLSLEQFSLDTAVISDFEDPLHQHAYPKDLKSIFEEILHKDEFQDDVHWSKANSLDQSPTPEGEKENEYSEKKIDVKLLGVENAIALDFSQELCLKILKQMQAFYDSGQNPKEVVLNISHCGIRVEDSDSKFVLFQHTLCKMSYITQDPHQPYVFGYIFGDFVNGHKFIAFKTEFRATMIVKFLKDILLREMMKKKKEEFDIKASQIYISLNDFDKVAQDMIVREKDIPSVLLKRVKLVEQIGWWLEGCSEDAAPVFYTPEDISLKVKIQDIFSKAVETKLIEREKDKEEKLEQAKAQKKHLKREKEDPNAKRTHVVKKPPSDPGLEKGLEIIKKQEELFQKNLEKRKLKLDHLEKHFKKLFSNVGTSSRFHETEIRQMKQLYVDLEKDFSEGITEREKEIENLKEHINYLSTKENSKKNNEEHKVSKVQMGEKQHLRTLEMELCSESIVQDYTSLDACETVNQEISEMRKKVFKCIELLLSAVRLRKEEIEDYNWHLNELHRRSHHKPSKESKIVTMSRILLVQLTQERLYELLDLKSAFKTMYRVDEDILSAVPNTCKHCKSIIESAVEKREKMIIYLHGLLIKFPDHTDVDATKPIVRELFNDFKHLVVSEKREIEQFMSKFNKLEAKLNMVPTIYNLFKDIISERKLEIDILVENFEKLDETFVDDLDSKDIELRNICMDICLTGIVMREKEINAYELEIQSDMEPETLKIICLKDIFYAALELERGQYEHLASSETEAKILPVEFTIKNLYDNVSMSLKKAKGQSELIDYKTPVKELQVFTSLWEFISIAFQQKQKEVEIPLSQLKEGLENVLCGFIDQVRSRESELISENKHHIQALRISKSWKEVFLLMAELRKAEVQNAIAKVIKDEQDKTAAFQYDSFRHLDHQGKQVLDSWKTILKSAVNMKQKELEKISGFITNYENNGPEEIQQEDIRSVKDQNAEVDTDDSRVKTSYSEVMEIIYTCKEIYTLVQNKSKTELEVLEHEMRPIFNPEYDEEIVETNEDEMTILLSDLKKSLLEFYERLREHDSKATITVGALNEIKGNIKNMGSAVKDSSKRFLTELLHSEEDILKFIENHLYILEETIENLSAKPEESIKPFTDLLVDVMSAEDISIDRANEEKEEGKDDIKEESEEAEKPLRYSRDEIEALLLEIDNELKGQISSEVEDDRKIQTVKVLSSCRDFFKLAADYRQKTIISVVENIEEIEKPDKKKMKPKQKLLKMNEILKSCQNIFALVLDHDMSEMKLILLEIDHICEVSHKKDISEEINPSDVVIVSRKLFSSFTETRKISLSLMEKEFNSLEQMEKNLTTTTDLKPKMIKSIKNEVFSACRDLVISSVDQKMREVDELSSQLESLNGHEEKVNAQLAQIPSEERNAETAKLEKVKDAISSCKKLCVYALEKAKNGMKDAEEELSLLKGIMETSKDSVVTSTCVSLLNLSLEDKLHEISDLQQILDALKCDAEKIAEKRLKKEQAELEKLLASKESSTDESLIEEDIPDMEMKEPVDSEVSAQQFPKETLEEDFKEFYEEILLHLSDDINEAILKCKEQIEGIETNIQKMKVTVTKVENEDSKVFQICNSAVLSCNQMRRDEIKLLESECKYLRNIDLNEVIAPDAEGEVDVFASCIKSLKLVVKNRKKERDAINFELMELIRYQEARLSHVCSNILLTTLELSNSERKYVETMLENLEQIRDKNKLLDNCISKSHDIVDLLEAQILSSEASLVVLSETKMNFDIEDSYFVNAFYEMLVHQINERKREITLYYQEVESVSSTKCDDKNVFFWVENIVRLLQRLLQQAIDMRKKEIENSECEVIKKLNIKVYDVVEMCKKDFLIALELRKDYLLKYDDLLQDINQVNTDEEIDEIKVKTVAESFLSLLPFAFERAEEERMTSKKDLNVLLGKLPISGAEEVSDATNVSSQGGPKLNIKGSEILSVCKTYLYRIIKYFEAEVKEMSHALDLLKELCKPSSHKEQKSLSETLPENHNYTSKQLALLEELELEMEKYQNYKENISFCELLYLTFINRKEDEIKQFKNILIKLNSVAENLLSEASQLLHEWGKLCKIEMSECNFCQDEFTPFQVIEKWTDHEVNIVKVADCIQQVKEKEEKSIGQLMIMFQSLELRSEILNKKILQTDEECSGLLQEAIKILEKELNLSEEGYEELKKYIDENVENDESDLTWEEKVIKNCKQILLNSVENNKNSIHVMNQELKFLLPSTEYQKPKTLPSWCERFLQFLGLGKYYAGGRSSSYLTSSLSPNALHQTNFESSKSARWILYKDLLKALTKKREILPAHMISTWSDHIIHAFLLEQLEVSDIESDKEISVGFPIDYTWDELLLNISELVGKAKQDSSLQESEKMMLIAVSTWLDIFYDAVTTWKKQTINKMKSTKNEITLLQWKPRLKPKEYSELVSSYFYDDESKIKELIGEVSFSEKMETKDFSLDLGLFSSKSIEHKTEEEDSDLENNDRTPWEDIFMEAGQIQSDYGVLASNIKNLEIKIQYKAEIMHSSWEETFLKATENFKNDLDESLKERTMIEQVANFVKEVVEVKQSERLYKLEGTLSSASWMENIFEAYQNYQENLEAAVKIKKKEVKKIDSHENNLVACKTDENPYLNVETTDVLSQGRKMFSRAFELQKSEIKTLDNQENNLEASADLKMDKNEVNKSNLHWDIIVAASLHFGETGRVLELKKQKRKEVPSQEIFAAVEIIKAKELTSKKTSRKTNNMNFSFQLDSKAEVSNFENLIQKLFLITAKDLKEAKKLESSDNYLAALSSSEDKLDMNVPWVDMFIEGVRQKLRELNPDDIDLQFMFTQQLASQATISWNEIFFILSNYEKKFMQERYEDENSHVLVSQSDLDNIRKLVTQENSLEEIILSAIEEYLRLLENNPKSERNSSWIDILPTNIGAERFQVEEDLLIAKIKLKHPNSIFVKEKLPDELIWKHLFPIAVMEWKQILKDYLINICNASLEDIEEIDDEEENENDPDTGSISISLPENKVPSKMDLIECIDTNGILEPKYFSIMASWREIYFAAIERKRKILERLIEVERSFVKVNEEKGNEDSDPSSSMPSYNESFSSITARDVLDSFITLRDLFEVVRCLRQKKLVVNKELDEKIKQSKNRPRGDIKASDVINIFEDLLLKVLLNRKKERNILQKELSRLQTFMNDHSKEPQASRLLHTLKKFYGDSVSIREKENHSISLELESLFDFKDLFIEYLECGVELSVQKRNQKNILVSRLEHKKIETIQKEFYHKLFVYIHNCTKRLEKSLIQRKDKIFSVDVEKVNLLYSRLKSEDQKLILPAKTSLVTLSELRTREISFMESEINMLSHNQDSKHNMEENVRQAFINAINFLSRGLQERKALEAQIYESINFIRTTNESIILKLHKTFARCKQLFYEAIEKRQNEIKVLDKDVSVLKSKLKKLKKKEAGILSHCDSHVKKAIDKRKQEITEVELKMRDMNDVQVKDFLKGSLNYHSLSIDKRRQEAVEIESLMEPLKLNEDDKGKEFSTAIDEALCDAFGVQTGMLFFKVEEKHRDADSNINPEVILLCKEFYSNCLQNVQKEIKSLEENYEALNSVIAALAEEVIDVMNKFVLILEKEYTLVRNEISVITLDLNTFKENYDKFLSDAMNIIMSGQECVSKSLNDTILDINDIKVQLKILSRGDTDQDIEDYVNKKIAEEDVEGDESNIESEIGSSPNILVMNLLKLSTDWRLNSLRSLSGKIEKLIETEIKSLQLVSLLANGVEDVFLEEENRKKENKEIESLMALLSAKDVPKRCSEILTNLFLYNSESLSSISSQLDRLTTTFETVQEERNTIFEFIRQTISYFAINRETVIETMTSELNYLSCLESEDAAFLTNLKNIFRYGIDERIQETAALEKDFKNWTSETEIYLIVNIILKHFQTSLEKRNYELSNVDDVKEALEIEADMNELLYSPALDSLKEVNETEIAWLKNEITLAVYIQRKLEIQGGKILEGCQRIYCSLFETLKIEMEAIKYDIRGLKNMKLEVEMIDHTDHELEIDFKDLFLEAFLMKKNDLMRDFHRKTIEKDILKKKQDVWTIVTQSEEPPSPRNIEATTFKEFLSYFQTKQEIRKNKMDNLITKELNPLETLFTLEKINIKAYNTFKTPFDASKEEVEADNSAQNFLHHVFEIRVQKIKEDMAIKEEKIAGVIKKRKILMNDLIKSKRDEMVDNILAKERQVKYLLNDIKNEESQLVSCLKDILNDIVQLKSFQRRSLKNWKELEKYLDHDLMKKSVTVKIENLFEVALSIKEAEFEIIKQSKLKEVEKSSLLMQKEALKSELDSYKKLDTALEKYFKAQKIKASIHVGLSNLESHEGFQEYVICDEEIFPDMTTFENFISNFNPPFDLRERKYVHQHDKVFRAFETCHLSFMQPYAYALRGFVGQLLKTYNVEVQSLSEAVSSIDLKIGNSSTASTLGDDIIPQNQSNNLAQKGVNFDITAVLTKNTSLLMLGSYINPDCNVALNLGRGFGLVYFEKTKNVKKWVSPVPDVNEVSVDIGLKDFGRNGCIDFLGTQFDWNITAVPLTLSKFESFIGDVGLLELIRSVFMELHHQNLLCRKCEMGNVFKNVGLSFKDITGFLNSKSELEMIQSIPVVSGAPSLEDVAIAQYASKVILIRGALLTSISLCGVLNQLERSNVKIVASSLFIEKYPEYQVYLKTFLSKLCPDKEVEFISCDNSSCSFGAPLAACIADSKNKDNPEFYLLELRKCLEEGNTFVSVKKFLNLVKNPDYFQEAFLLAKEFYASLQFDVPLSVVWAFHFMEGQFTEAEELFNKYPVSLKSVNSLVCQKIRTTENFEMWGIYKDFVNELNADKKLKIKVYRSVFDLLVAKSMYTEAIAAVQELVEMGIRLSNLQLPSLHVLHNFCNKPSSKSENIPSFFLPVKETYIDGSLDSD